MLLIRPVTRMSSSPPQVMHSYYEVKLFLGVVRNSHALHSPLWSQNIWFVQQLSNDSGNGLQRFLQRLGITAHAEEVVLLYSDSTSALTYAKHPKFHGKAKHIEVRYQYIRDMVSQGEVILQHIYTSSMVANPLTNPIVRDLFFSHAKSIGLRRICLNTSFFLTKFLLLFYDMSIHFISFILM